MRGAGHVRTAVIAALVGALAATGTVALAGSGVGGVFNLGQNNTVDNATTMLTGTNTSAMLDVSNTNSTSNRASGIVGRTASNVAAGLAGSSSGGGIGVKGTSTNGSGLYGQSTSGAGGRLLSTSGNALFATGQGTNPTLRVQNTSTGPGAAFQTDPSAPPFTVSSSQLVPNLNADKVDGQDAAAFQLRVTGSCGIGHYIRSINADGTVVCGRYLAGIVTPTGAIYSGTGFTSVRNSLGNYTVTAPVGTFADQPNVVPTITPLFTAHTAAIPDFVQNFDGSMSLTVDFGGVDAYFAFTVLPESS